MKKCPKCNKIYDDDYSFCNICGGTLQNDDTTNLKKKLMERRDIIIGIVVVCLVASIGIGITVSEQRKMKETRQEIEDYKYEKAVREYKATPTTSDIKVNSDWTQKKSGDYIYINGSVTNTSSSKTISYFEVEAKFYDSKGNVIDSDWTNDGDDLEPGESRKFEIMHKYDSNTKDIRLSIKDVN